MSSSSSTENGSKTVIVASLDWDANLANGRLTETGIPELDDNLFLWYHLYFYFNDRYKPAHYIMMSGSFRQTQELDRMGIAEGKGSSFQGLPKLIKETIRSFCWEKEYRPSVALYPLLLEDVLTPPKPSTDSSDNKKLPRIPSGTFFCNPVPSLQSIYFNDQSKIGIVYAQMWALYRKIQMGESIGQNDDPLITVTIHKNDQVIFTVYDDATWILGILHCFFSLHPELIPPHFTLQLYQHVTRLSPEKTEQKPTLFRAEILRPATATYIDSDYRATVLAWSTEMPETHIGDDREYRTGWNLYGPSALEKSAMQPSSSATPTSSSSSAYSVPSSPLGLPRNSFIEPPPNRTYSDIYSDTSTLLNPFLSATSEPPAEPTSWWNKIVRCLCC